MLSTVDGKHMRTLEYFSLKNKIIVVTGGAGLYGRPIVQALAEAGGTVIIASRNRMHSEVAADGFRQDGLAVEALRCDLTSEAEILDLRRAVLERHGRLDVLFNNAVGRAGTGLFEMSAADWEGTMRVNSTGLFLASKHLSEPMREQRSGSIVNIASIYGMVGPDFSIYEGTPLQNPANYSFSKGGMINFTRYLASALGPYGIRVNCLSPGGLQTPEMPERFVAQYAKRTLLGRMANEEDIKGPAVFLASEASRYITGANIAVDAGWTAI
jgi:NAD(P)-dependent dehydrogenase (short-subunit alcohol dehydrogenase family)